MSAIVNEVMEELKLQSSILLENSKLCRLCSEENENGISLYEPNENSESLFAMVNTYLPLKVLEDDLYPKTICPGCHIQLEATKLFMDLIIQGQQKLRDLLKSYRDQCYREEKERQKLEHVLQNHNPNASVETYAIQTDENGEKFIIQIYSDGPLFSPEHQLVLRAEGLNRPKRKRGRPPKAASAENTQPEPSVEEKDESLKPVSQEEETGLPRKRKIRPPARYAGVVHGKELVNILKKEGIVDDETDNLEEEETGSNEKGYIPPAKNEALKAIVGKVLEDHGEEMVEQLVFMKTKRVRDKVKKRGSVKPKYICEICKKAFQHYGRCEMHKRSHKIRFGCEEENCSVQDENREVIINHQEETGHKGISVFEFISKINGIVKLADASDVCENNLTTFTRIEQNDKSYQCDKCEKAFTCKQNYEVHFKAVHDEEKEFQCKICNKYFAYACSLKKHMIVHNLEAPNGIVDEHKCDVCDKIFHHPSSLLYHKNAEHGNKRYLCNKCNKSFKHRQLLLRHQSVHSDDRPFKCRQCTRQFKSKTNLATHEKVHKGFKQFVCPICGNTFVHKASLWVHLKWHNGDKPFNCEVCNKTFSQKGNLVEHQRIHTGDKPFVCNVCERSFTTSSQHKLHMKRHTGEKPFTCKYCMKSFLHKDTFGAHIRRHLGEKPFHCKYCTKTFPEQWACMRHERVHLGLKKYKCDVCHKSFLDGSNLKKHRKTHQRIDTRSEILLQKPEHVSSSAVEPQLSIISEGLIPVEKAEVADLKIISTAVPPHDLQIHDLLDHEGNSTNITTADGQQILIVSSGNKNFQGLLPDGRLVNFNIFANEPNDSQEQEETPQLMTTANSNLLSSELQFLEDNSDSVASEDKQTFISEDGKVCFITGFDENSFLTMS